MTGLRGANLFPDNPRALSLRRRRRPRRRFSRLIACVGNDDHGQSLRATLETEGIVVVGVSVASALSGVAVVITAAGGDNMIVVAPEANAMLLPAMLNADQFAMPSHRPLPT